MPAPINPMLPAQMPLHPLNDKNLAERSMIERISFSVSREDSVVCSLIKKDFELQSK